MNTLWRDMKTLWQRASVSQPRRDGNRVLFAIGIEGKRIPCAISRAALQSLSGHPQVATSDLLRHFADSRDTLEEIAANIFYVTPEWVAGPISIWADDIDDPPSAHALPHNIIPLDRRCYCGSDIIAGALASGGRWANGKAGVGNE